MHYRRKLNSIVACTLRYYNLERMIKEKTIKELVDYSKAKT